MPDVGPRWPHSRARFLVDRMPTNTVLLIWTAGRVVQFYNQRGTLAEVALPQDLFRQILQRIRRLGPIPDTG